MTDLEARGGAVAETAPDSLGVIRAAYDRIAVPYAQRFHHHLDGKPVDRAMLAAFAGLVAACGNSRVADVGCGTGATTAILAGLGVEPFGVDLAPQMVEQARRLNPGVDFTVGSMTELPLPDGEVGGVCAWYSIVHLRDDQLDMAFAEFARVLAPGGFALLAFQIGDEPRVLTEAFGHAVALTFHRRPLDRIAASLGEAGLVEHCRAVRAAEGSETTPQAFLVVRKPSR